MSDTNTMYRIPDKCLHNGHKQVAFERYWRNDFVGEALTIEIDDQRTLHKMEFYSSDFGIVQWKQGIGLSLPHGWEVQGLEDESRTCRYQCTLLNGALPSHSADGIIRQVMQYFNLPRLEAVVEHALGTPAETSVLPLGFH